MSVGALCSPSPAVTPDELGSLPIDVLGDAEVVGELRRLHRVGARIAARSAELIDAAARRGIPQAEGFGSTAGWLMALTGDPPSMCHSRVRVARSLRSMPVTRGVFSSGELSEPRVRMLVECCHSAPEAFARDEKLLVAQARRLAARAFPVALAHWRRLADLHGALQEAARAFERRHLHVSATWAGMVRLDGDLDPESGAVVITALASLADPAALDRSDRRSPAQRRADALTELCRRHLDSADRPLVGGERPHLTVTVDLDALAGAGEGLADLDTGPITLEAVRRLACDAAIGVVVSGSDSRPLAVGRRHPVVGASLRRALTARDGGCTHPGCDLPARWCDAHHLVHWAQGGATDPANPSS